MSAIFVQFSGQFSGQFDTQLSAMKRSSALFVLIIERTYRHRNVKIRQTSPTSKGVEDMFSKCKDDLCEFVTCICVHT